MYCKKASLHEGFFEMCRRFSSEASFPFFLFPFRAIVSVSTGNETDKTCARHGNNTHSEVPET